MTAIRPFVAFTSADVDKAAVSGNAWVELNFGTTADDTRPAAERRRKVLLHRYKTMRATGVSATAHTALVADVTASASTAYATKHVGPGAAAGVSESETGINKPIYTDTSGKLHFTPGGDAADTFSYELWFEVLQ